jgi:hypothetical protein
MTGATAAMAGLVGGAASFGVSVSPPNVNGTYRGSSGVAQNIATSSAIATVSGGTAPFTYAWSQVGSSPYTWTIGSPAAATSNFTGNAIGKGEDAEADFKCTVTDATGLQRSAQTHAHVINVSTA